MLSENTQSLRYRDAGVDIGAGDALVEAIKPLARSTFRPGCLGGLGGFGALFEMPEGYQNPVLVSGTDGVGTKLKLAFQLDRHDTIGIDLVAMCVNDILVLGAEPLFFLDYFATGRLDPERATAVVSGIAEGCRQAGAALIGGETAEMPGMYGEGEYDLAGFCVGVVERDRILDGSAVESGDCVIGVAASGVHSNGFSLIRRLIDREGIDMGMKLDHVPLADHLLQPTRIYVNSVLPLLSQVPIHAIAHITGGGLPGNLERVLPAGCHARIQADAWEWPDIFSWIQRTGDIQLAEMYRTFNCGVGLVLVLSEAHCANALAQLRDAGETAFVIGNVESGDGKERVAIK